MAKGFLEPRERERAQSAVNLLNEGMNNRDVVLPAEERGDRDTAPQKRQRLKSFLGGRLGLSGQWIRHGNFKRSV